ncbi:MAG: hypothetical protein HOP33_17875 [Verrucomicrobia bacterium]|nr:hypothetical protein [Verrucomicrobiota bacterium]
MPKWLQGMIAPTLTLWFCMVAFALAAVASPDGAGLSARADLASRFAIPMVMASWVMADARKRGLRLCHDYDSFVFFVWPIVVPVYLFKTRGVRAFLTLVCFIGIWLIASLPALALVLYREFASP